MSRKFELCYSVPIDPSAPRGRRIDIHTRVHVWDEHSYHWSRLLVRERTFGFINRRWFKYVELNSLAGAVHAYDSEEFPQIFNTRREKRYFFIKRLIENGASWKVASSGEERKKREDR